MAINGKLPPISEQRLFFQIGKNNGLSGRENKFRAKIQTGVSSLIKINAENIQIFVNFENNS